MFTDGEPTTKTIYVGTDKFLTALSKHGLTIEELNDLLTKGYQVDDAGNIQEPLTVNIDKGKDNKASFFDWLRSNEVLR